MKPMPERQRPNDTPGAAEERIAMGKRIGDVIEARRSLVAADRRQ
jgi:hypothetical protein